MASTRLEAVLWTIDAFGDSDVADSAYFNADVLESGRLDLVALPAAALAAVRYDFYSSRRPQPYRLIVGTVSVGDEVSLPVAIMRFTGPNDAREWEFAKLASALFADAVELAA